MQDRCVYNAFVKNDVFMNFLLFVMKRYERYNKKNSIKRRNTNQLSILNSS